MGRPAASLLVTALDHGVKQKPRFGGDDPDASRLLKNSGRLRGRRHDLPMGRISLTTRHIRVKRKRAFGLALALVEGAHLDYTFIT